jgi:hypothetical protein
MINKKEKVIKKKKFVKKEKVIKKKKIVKKKIVKKEKVIKKKKIVRKKKKIVKKKKYGGSPEFDNLLDELLKVARKDASILVFKFNHVNYVFIGEIHDTCQEKSYISIINDKFDKIKSLILLESESKSDIKNNTNEFVKHYRRDKELNKFNELNILKGKKKLNQSQRDEMRNKLNQSQIDQTIIYLSNKIQKKKSIFEKKNNFRDDSKKYINQEIAFIDDRSRIEVFSKLCKNPNQIVKDIEFHKSSDYFKLPTGPLNLSSLKKYKLFEPILNALHYKLNDIQNFKKQNPKILPQILTNIENKINSHIKVLNSKYLFGTVERIGHIFIDINIILNYIIQQKFEQGYVFAFLGNNHISNIKEFISPEISTDYIKYEKKNKKWKYVKN